MTTQVTIKLAAQNADDFTLDCEITWTIAQLKDKLSSLHPTKPKREHQKLIYSGKLLPDHLPLKSFLNRSQDIHIIHLVCPPPDAPDKKNVKESKLAVSATPSPPPLNPQMNEHLLGTSSLTNGGISMNTWNSHADPNQQYVAAQQMYIQMMSQYYAQLSGTVPYGPIVPPLVQHTPPEVTRQNAPANRQQPGINEEDQRDYIDYLYTFSRMIMLAVFLLYYSSATRVFAVVSMILLLSMFAKLNRQRQREEQQRARRATERAPPEEAPAATPASEDEQATDETSAQPETPPQTSQNQSPPPTSVPSTIFALVASFFSSLIPSDPMPVNVN